MDKIKKLKCLFVNSNKDKVYMFNHLIEHMGKALKENPYDLYGSKSHFDKWCDAKGYGKFDSIGKRRSASNIWFQEYESDNNGLSVCPAYITITNIFIDYYPEIFSLTYHDDLEGTETYVLLNFILEELKKNPDKKDIENKKVKFIESLIETYGDSINICYQPS